MMWLYLLLLLNIFQLKQNVCLLTWSLLFIFLLLQRPIICITWLKWKHRFNPSAKWRQLFSSITLNNAWNSSFSCFPIYFRFRIWRKLPVTMASRDTSTICLFDVDGTLTLPRQVSCVVRSGKQIRQLMYSPRLTNFGLLYKNSTLRQLRLPVTPMNSTSQTLTGVTADRMVFVKFKGYSV